MHAETRHLGGTATAHAAAASTAGAPHGHARRHAATASGAELRSTQSDSAGASVVKSHRGPKNTPEPPRDQEGEQPPGGGRPADDPEPPVKPKPRREPPTKTPRIEEPQKPKKPKMVQ